MKCTKCYGDGFYYCEVEGEAVDVDCDECGGVGQVSDQEDLEAKQKEWEEVNDEGDFGMHGI